MLHSSTSWRPNPCPSRRHCFLKLWIKRLVSSTGNDWRSRSLGVPLDTPECFYLRNNFSPRKRDLSDQLLVGKLTSSGKKLSWFSVSYPTRLSSKRLIHRRKKFGRATVFETVDPGGCCRNRDEGRFIFWDPQSSDAPEFYNLRSSFSLIGFI